MLTWAPHLRLTWLWELRSPPEDCQGVTSPHNPSVLLGAASQVGEVSGFKGESPWAGKGGWGPASVTR